MDKLTHYRMLIKKVLGDLAAIFNRQPNRDVETVCVFDEEHDCYQLTDVGWSQNRRVHTSPLFVRLRNGKIWIEEDATDYGIAHDFLAAGVPKEDIVLAFHHPEVWPLTEFAVA